jgi:hypothetical protein
MEANDGDLLSVVYTLCDRIVYYSESHTFVSTNEGTERY